MGGSLLQGIPQGGRIEDIVSQHQTHPVLPHKFPTDQQGVGNAPGHRLLGVGDLQTILLAVSQQSPEGIRLIRGNDDHNV